MNTTDNRYKLCTIYFLAHKDDVISKKNIYIGHTIEIPKERWGRHKYHCNNPNSHKYNTKLYRYIRDNGNISNWTFNILFHYPCDNLEEATIKEKEIINIFPNNLNTLLAINSLYYPDTETNLEIIEKNNIVKKKQADYMKEYRRKKKELHKQALESLKKVHV
jgi:hypothetical protein